MKFLLTLIQRPVVAIVLNLLLVMGGFLAFKNLGVAQYPNIDQPVVTVTTTYVGANPELIERMITTPIEDKLSGIEGVKYFSSTSVMNTSTITITFELGADIDAGVSEVRNRVDQARQYFPDDAEPPVTTHQAGGQPIAYLSLSSDQWDVLALTEYYKVALKTRLESIPGIQEMQEFGLDYAMRIWIDPEKLAARKLTPLDIVNAVNNQNLDLPGGVIENEYREYQVESETELNTADQFNDLIIAYRDNYPIRLKDVGRAELGGEYVPPLFAVLVDGQNTLAMAVKIYEDANAIDVVNRLRDEMKQINADLPADLNLTVSYDTTLFIKDSIREVVTTIGEAILLVILVVSVFLWSPRAIAIPVITIPLSLAGALGFMYLMGFSINLMTLLALVLAIGLVVDDGIVVLENTFRHIEQRVPSLKAATISLREIMFPIISTTLTLAIVYFPIGFLGGQTGELFRQFAFTLAGTVCISGYIALTLSPMMCGHLLRPKKKHVDEMSRWLPRNYKKLLGGILKHGKIVIILLAVAIASGAYGIYSTLPSELMPIEDVNAMFVFFQAPEGSNFQYMSKAADNIGKILAKVPEGQTLINIIGNPQSNQGMAILVLKPKDERLKAGHRTQQQIVKDLTGPMMALPGVLAIPLNPPPPSMGGSSNQQVNFVLTTIGEYEDLETQLDKLMGAKETLNQIAQPQTDLNLHVQKVDITPNRNLIATGSITANEVAMNIAASLAPYRVTRIKREGRNYDVFVQMHPDDRRDPGVVERLYVRNNDTNDLIPLSSLVDVTHDVGAIQLNHYMGNRSVTINANVAEGSSLGEALNYLENTTEQQLKGVTPFYTGYSETFIESQGQFVIVFGVALIVVYLVLSGMFNSFIDPFIILLTVPLSLFGGLALLKLAGASMNLYSQIGLVTLMGLISKHGILIVDFANEQRRDGMPLREAIITAAQLRLRPILMTTGAMVLGAVPLAITTGPGSESRHPLGYVIIGGMTFGTCLTLLVIPTAYYLLARFEKPRHNDEVDPDSDAASKTDATPA